MTRNYSIKLNDVDGNPFYQNSEDIHQAGKPPGFTLIIQMGEISDPNIAPGDSTELHGLPGKSYRVDVTYDLSHEEKINVRTKVTASTNFDLDIGTPL